jgi:hypothetical protein
VCAVVAGPSSESLAVELVARTLQLVLAALLLSLVGCEELLVFVVGCAAAALPRGVARSLLGLAARRSLDGSQTVLHPLQRRRLLALALQDG